MGSEQLSKNLPSSKGSHVPSRRHFLQEWKTVRHGGQSAGSKRLGIRVKPKPSRYQMALTIVRM